MHLFLIFHRFNNPLEGHSYKEFRRLGLNYKKIKHKSKHLRSGNVNIKRISAFRICKNLFD